MLFSELAWTANTKTYEKIVQQQFIQELINGSLDKEKFAYYIEQDSIYLIEFAKSLAVIATRSDHPDEILQFMDFARGALIAERDGIHMFFRDQLNYAPKNKISIANFGYTSYLSSTTRSSPIEIGIAALVPCFWIYKEVGQYIYNNGYYTNHPFAKWIEGYASKEFATGVKNIVDIANKYYEKSNIDTQQQMLEAFKNSVLWEYHFWHDANSYNLLEV
jgi:thiaminase (transcriptional activator TenA)